MKKIALLISIFVILTLTHEGSERCICTCVNGEVVPICDNALEIRPICPPPPPSIRPIEPLTIPLIGTSNCIHEEVMNP